MQYFHWKRLTELTKKQRAYLVLALVVFFLLIIGIVQRSAVANQLHSWKVLPQQERLTELFFPEHLSLPDTYKPGEPQEVIFALRNLEGKDIAYNYTISAITEDGTTTQLIRNTATLRNLESKRVTDTIILPDLGSRIKVEIAINNNSQSISYWTERAL